MAKGRLKRRLVKKEKPDSEEPKQEPVETQEEDIASVEPELLGGPVQPLNEEAVEVDVVKESDGAEKDPNAKEEKVIAEIEKGAKGNGKKVGEGKNNSSAINTSPAGGKAVDRKAEIAGLIFLCNSSTKKDCFKYRVFGLPEAQKEIVEQVKKGIKLFLFDIDQRLLYGVYKASSAGGMNLESEAFKYSRRKFPAQVRFNIHKDCLPIEENIFKQAIRENYFGRNKFKPELNVEQVGKLMRLFRPVDARGLPQPKHGKDASRGTSFINRIPQGPPLSRPPFGGAAARYPREYAPLYPRERVKPALESRRLEQSRSGPQDLYQADIDLVESEALYRQTLLMRQMQDARLDISDRRAEDVYRDIGVYQRRMPLGSYTDGLHVLPATLPYASMASQLAWQYP